MSMSGVCVGVTLGRGVGVADGDGVGVGDLEFELEMLLDSIVGAGISEEFVLKLKFVSMP
jgi:hypothetical protein